MGDTENHSLMATYEQVKRKLQEKLDGLLEFNGRSPDIFVEIEILKSAVSRGAEVASVSWNSSIGTFTVVKPDKMNWAKDINELWREKQNKERQVKLNALIVELKKCDSISYTSGRNASWMILKNGKIVYDESVQKLFNQYSYETISGLVDVNIVHILGREGIYLFPGGWGNGALTGITK